MLRYQDDLTRPGKSECGLEFGDEGCDGKIDMFCRPNRTLLATFEGKRYSRIYGVM